VLKGSADLGIEGPLNLEAGVTSAEAHGRSERVKERHLSNGWIGVDLDGTLAYYDEWRGLYHIGEPIPAMVDRVKRWLAEGRDVRIFTARVSGNIAVDKSGEPTATRRLWRAISDCGVRSILDALCP